VSFLQLSLCGLVIAGLTGCGGGSNNGGSNNNGGGSPTTVTYDFTSTPISAAPVAVATKIGSAAFTQATLTGGTLTISVPSGETNYAVAYLCPTETLAVPPANYEYVVEASTVDGTAKTGECSGPNTAKLGLATGEVNATAIPGAEGIWGIVGGYWDSGFGSTLTMNEDAPLGTYDVPVLVTTGGASFGDIAAAKILRAQTIPGVLNGGNLIDFTASDETTQQPITFTNLPSGYIADSPSASYETAGGVSILLNLLGPAGEYTALPAGTYQSGDYYQIAAGAYTGVSTFQGVGVLKIVTSGGPQNFTLPAPWTYAGPTAASLPTFNLSYSGFSGMANISESAIIQWNQGTVSQNLIEMTTTANYQSGATSITIPDLSGLTGFIAPATSGTTITWTANVFQGDPFLTTPPSGIVQSVGAGGTYTEP